jgi:hypothetical protein
MATFVVSGDGIVGAAFTVTDTVGEVVTVTFGVAPSVVPVSVKIT